MRNANDVIDKLSNFIYNFSNYNFFYMAWNCLLHPSSRCYPHKKNIIESSFLYSLFPDGGLDNSPGLVTLLSGFGADDGSRMEEEERLHRPSVDNTHYDIPWTMILGVIQTSK